MPPSDLISVRNFRDQFAGFVRAQKDRGVFNGQAEWSPEVRKEVADRCRIADDLSFSNSTFVNPTLFHMLRQHREFNEATERELLQKKRSVAAELERKHQRRTAESQNGEEEMQEGLDGQQAGDMAAVEVVDVNVDGLPGLGQVDGINETSTGHADGSGQPADASMLLAIDVDANEPELGEQTMDVDSATVEDALARLVNGGGMSGDQDAEENGGMAKTEDEEDEEEAEEEMQGETGSGFDSEADAEAQSDAAQQHESAEDAASQTHTDKTDQSTNGAKTNGDVEIKEEDEGDDGSDASDSESNSDETSGSDSSDTSGDEGSERSYSSSSQKDAANGAEAKDTTMKTLAKSFEDVTLLTPRSELPKGITEEMLKRAIANSGFVRSTDIEVETRQAPKQRVRMEEPAGVSELENKFRKVKESLDDSTLASLRKANRRMVPPKYRLDVNFMTNRVQNGSIPDATPVADDEVILSVCFYNTRSSTSKMEEYLVLGSQSLTVLRDAFYCISDFLVSHRDEEIENTKDRKVSSSYFFIEKTFYNDMRSPTATDYSRVIMEWANDPERQQKNPHLQGLQSRLMDGARFLDLSIRLKQPYVFMHQGDCEHVVMFTDLRLLGPKDDQFVECYPKQIFRTRHMRHKCRMCSAYPAQYVTKNDFHSGMSPCYFCEKCYQPFHFDADGNKLLEHDVFPYANVNLL
ncbi:hypothetical protein GGI07_003011 [Coemansia sp. Benny D115]|nr:hypothetical protein GGI07_003011 [Coemansia sp. Benny D115]